MSILHMQEDHPTMDMLTTECVKEKFCFNVMFAGVGWGGGGHRKTSKCNFKEFFFFKFCLSALQSANLYTILRGNE